MVMLIGSILVMGISVLIPKTLVITIAVSTVIVTLPDLLVIFELVVEPASAYEKKTLPICTFARSMASTLVTMPLTSTDRLVKSFCAFTGMEGVRSDGYGAFNGQNGGKRRAEGG